MAVRKSLATLFLVMVLGACAELGAEQPLFSAVDQGPAPLREGVWIGVGEGCAEHNIRRRRFPAECGPLDIRREPDGAWQFSLRIDLISGLSARERADEAEKEQNGPYRLILAPAVERALDGAYAPLYVAELGLRDDGLSSVSYAAVAPIGTLPASEMRIVALIGCDTILRDGPIDGVTVQYETRTDAEGRPYQEISGCDASHQAAVREAVRRAVIEDLDTIVSRRYVFVREN